MSVSTPHTVLVVEPDRASRVAIVTALSEAGYRVRTARTGYNALRLARAISPDVILLDLLQPHMTGDEVLCRLEQGEEGRQIPIVVVSAYARRLHAAGRIVRVLQRGFELTELVDDVRAAIEARARASALPTG